MPNKPYDNYAIPNYSLPIFVSIITTISISVSISILFYITLLNRNKTRGYFRAWLRFWIEDIVQTKIIWTYSMVCVNSSNLFVISEVIHVIFMLFKFW